MLDLADPSLFLGIRGCKIKVIIAMHLHRIDYLELMNTPKHRATMINTDINTVHPLETVLRYDIVVPIQFTAGINHIITHEFAHF